MGIHPSEDPMRLPSFKRWIFFLNAAFAIRKACNSWRVLYPRRFGKWVDETSVIGLNHFGLWTEFEIWDGWMVAATLCVFQHNSSYCRWLAWIRLNMCLDFTTWSSLKGQPIGNMFTGTREYWRRSGAHMLRWVWLISNKVRCEQLIFGCDPW